MRSARTLPPFVCLATLCTLACQGSSAALDPHPPSTKLALELGFDLSTPERVPSGASVVSGEWKVLVDESAPSPKNVLAQTAGEDKEPFHLLLLDDVKAADVDASVKLRAVSGESDQGGGLVWRAKDARNYYLARWNPLEKNVRIYELVDGERHQLASAAAHLEPGWHELRVVAKGEQFRCSIDGRALLSAKDSSFLEAGKVGLWTKADARTNFDDLKIATPK